MKKLLIIVFVVCSALSFTDAAKATTVEGDYTTNLNYRLVIAYTEAGVASKDNLIPREWLKEAVQKCLDQGVPKSEIIWSLRRMRDHVREAESKTPCL